ncbi:MULTISPECIES: aldose epimerase family protein [unclassified Flavobacterium]|jgi:aldose 1-epimerase|uniref:aldose epimerase family protein n=1 Tax=unclassified Flavobacterium TaxID=196869 RepID=UPI0025BB1DB5|nr:MULTISPECIES: aldose epimerase family protein [unclassified Flavobacterium]
MAISPLFTDLSNPQLSIHSKLWGITDGKDVRLYTLTNSKGMVVEITNYGGIVVSIVAPDRKGKFENVVLGFDNLIQYEKQNSPYMGTIIGRYANRISKAKFVLDNIQYNLVPNDHPNHSHGGIKGFSKVVWDTSEITGADSVGVALQYSSKDMEEGYPGNFIVKITYVLNNDNELKIYYEAKTDKPTILNLTHHSYFNLAANKENILGHELTIFADSITPTDSLWIPTGKIAPVAGSDFDFTQPHLVGERINNLAHGYNMNFVLRKNCKNEPSKAAEVFDSTTGRFMEVYTTEPGLQLYTGDYLDGSITGSGNIVFGKNMGLCLEAQHFPDSPNKSDFPSTVLRPGETYTQLTIYKLSTK